LTRPTGQSTPQYVDPPEPPGPGQLIVYQSPVRTVISTGTANNSFQRLPYNMYVFVQFSDMASLACRFGVTAIGYSYVC
jgi:hypothetical protein